MHLWVFFKGMARFPKPSDFMIEIQEFKSIALHKATPPRQGVLENCEIHVARHINDIVQHSICYL